SQRPCAENASAIQHYLPELRHHQNRDDANGCVSIFLQLRELRYAAQAEAGRLLRVLLVWRPALSSGSGWLCMWVTRCPLLAQSRQGGAFPSRMTYLWTRPRSPSYLSTWRLKRQ